MIECDLKTVSLLCRVLSGHPTMSTLRTVLLTDNYIVIVTDFVSGTSLSSFWTRTLHAPVEKEHEQEAASPTEAVTTVAHNFEAHTYTCASVQHCTGDEEASDSLPLPHSPKSWKRMSEPVSRRATHAGVPVVAACTDSEDEDLYFLTSQHTNGIHMHAPHACSSAAQDQPSQSAFTAKRRTDPVAGATPLQGEHRWLREKMYGDYGEVAQNDLEASDDDEPVEESVESTITHVTAAPLLHVQRPHAKRFSESAVQSPSMNATHASQHKLRQSSSGVLPTRSSSRQLAHKRCSQPVTVHTHSKVEHVYADHSRSTSPLPLPDVVPEQPECSRPPSEAQNIPQKHAQAPMCSKPGPSHMQKSSPFSEGTFSSPPVGQGSCKACLSVTGMHDMHNPAPLERVPTPEATQLHTCMASPSATVHGMHGRMHAPPIARLFSDQSDEFWGTDDSDDEDTYTNNPASRCSFESSTASGVLGTSPYNTLRPPARLRASSINVPTNATNIFNSPVKNSSRTKRASQNIPKGKRRQQARAARAAQGMTPRNTSLKILEGSPSMATPVPNVLGGTSPGATENLQQLAQRTHSQAAQSCAASLVTSSSSSSSDGSELSASASSSSKEACMLFMHASQKYSAQFSKKDDAHSINMRRVATSQHAQPSSRPVHGCRVADASQNRTERPSRSQYVAEECKKKPHEQAGFVQRMHVVRKIFQQLLSLLEASHKHDVFLGALHPQNVMVTWEEGESKNDPPSVRVYVTSAGYLRELHELDVCPCFSFVECGPTDKSSFHSLGRLTLPHCAARAQCLALLSTRLWVMLTALYVQDAAAAGAPGYLQRFMPPEQLQGMPRSPDGDVWAAGALLFYLLCGREPFPLESSTQHRAWQNCMVHAPESLEWPAECAL